MGKFLSNSAIILGMFLIFSFVVGFLNSFGLGLSEDGQGSVGAAMTLVLIAAFCIAGCRVETRRVRHLCWLAAAFWMLNNLACLGMSLSEGFPTDSETTAGWMSDLLVKFFVGNLFLTLFCAAVGGILSMAIMDHRRTQKKELV